MIWLLKQTPLLMQVDWHHLTRRENMEEVKRTVDDERQLVVFRLYGEEFGIEITKVREIVKPREIT